MQKLLRRTAAAERQVARKLALAERQKARQQRSDRNRDSGSAVNDVNSNIAHSRRSRHEHWELGPIAPNREAELNHGLVTSGMRVWSSAGSSDFPLREAEIDQRCAWAGGRKHLNLVAGDRVVILHGHDKGKIDEVADVNLNNGTISLKYLHKGIIRPPDFLASTPGYTQKITLAAPLPISAVRLVHPITDPETGVTRDVVVKRILSANFRYDRPTKTTEWDRYVPGLNVIIPWPEKEHVQEEAKAGDTLRADVDRTTFVPTLLRPPMPEVVVNELRNQYSRFRTRHEDWYLEKKEAEVIEKKQGQALALKSMRTPLQDFNRQQRDMRRARGQPQLSPEMLEKIGQVIAKNKDAALASAGMEALPSESR